MRLEGVPGFSRGSNREQNQPEKKILPVEVMGVRMGGHPSFPGSTFIRAGNGFEYALRKKEDGSWEGNQVVLNRERTEVMSTQQLQQSFFEDPRNALILKEAELAQGESQ